MSRSIVLTGARGALGMELFGTLHAQGYEVVRGSRVGGDGYVPLETAVCEHSLREASVVVHLAWSTVPATSELDPGIEWQVDLPFLRTILRRITQIEKIARPHFVFLSSGGTVYGNAPDRPSVESDPTMPLGWHGAGKVAAEQMIREFANRVGLESSILRVSNPYGFDLDETRKQGVIPHIVHALLDGRPFRVWGDGSVRKDFLAISDFTEALRRVCELRPTGTFNVCSGVSHSLREVIDLVASEIGVAAKLEFEPVRSWDVSRSMLCPEAFTRATGWSATVQLEQGLAEMLARYGVKAVRRESR